MLAKGMVVILGAMLAGQAPPAFTKKPAVLRVGQAVKIQFAVDRDTDLAVYIEDAKGRIVRHLVAGMLGKNPPPPLKPGLDQSIQWDGKDDDGLPVVGRPLKVRVGLGLKASWGGTAFAEETGPNNIGDVSGLAVGPDGRLFVHSNAQLWMGNAWTHRTIHVFRRDGAYERTIKPFPATLAADRLKPFAAFVPKGGRLTPVVHNLLSTSVYPNGDVGGTHLGMQYQMAVTQDGKLVLACGGDRPYLGVLDMGGAPAYPSFEGAPLSEDGKSGFSRAVFRPKRGVNQEAGPRLLASPDGQWVYMTGFGRFTYFDGQGNYATNSHAVYRVRMPDRGKPEKFFGDPATAGDDDKHLNDPKGIAFDPGGSLLVADCGNDRVVALGPDGRFLGSFPVSTPVWVGVHPKTGAVYVQSGQELVKFAGWKDPKEISRLNLRRLAKVGTPWGGDAGLAFSFALDASTEPPVLWIGRSTLPGAFLDKPLVRCEDRGTSFGDPEPAKAWMARRVARLATDPTHRVVMAGDQVLDEATGQIRTVRTEGFAVGNGQGLTRRLDRDGNIYCMQAGGGIWKCDPSGKRVPFAATAGDANLKGHLDSRPMGNTAWERDFCVDRRGNLYVKNRGDFYHGYMAVDKYGPDGKFLQSMLWCVSDGAFGPKIDPQGNLYIAEAVKPLGLKWPEEFDGRLPADDTTEHWYNYTYGSIMKFGPHGGAVWFPQKDKRDAYAFQGEPKLDRSPAKMTAGWYRQTSKRGFVDPMDAPVTLQGALWMHFGFSPVMDMHRGGDWRQPCHCTGTSFDVDDFGRVFYPDQFRFRATVLDTNGNVILHVGAYGNQDCCGPGSYVLDVKERCFRPRKADDPQELTSPFAEPEIAFCWITEMVVTDRHLYVADAGNKRVLRVRLDYAASETAMLP